jgi:hypothetical protein
MKKLTSLVALSLLAVSGTGLAVTCAQDNVPAATLLVPYFKVSRNGSTGGNIAEGGVDTLCAITNVSSTGVIAHITVWNKYSKAVLDWNVPLTAFDVAFWRMKDVMNGKLNLNPNTQRLTGSVDPCGLNVATGAYAPTTGFGATRYIRFGNPDAVDAGRSISVYSDPAYSGGFRTRVWDSLDESGDISTMTSAGGANILDTDNRGCGVPVDGQYSGDFSGYLTIDVVNYCTNYFPDEPAFYVNDAIATAGWSSFGYTPNSLIGDIFYVDPNANGGNISGDSMVSVEFDTRLNWLTMNTFYGRYFTYEPVAGALAPAAFRFIGDGREPLGTRYGVRFLADSASQLQSWALVYRADIYNNPDFSADVNLCDWYINCIGGGPCAGYGLYDSIHQLAISTFDNDENRFVPGGGPSGGGVTVNLYVFLESQRISLLNPDFNPGAFKGGWIDLRFPGNPAFNEAWVGVQHTGPGLALSVGHSTSLLTNQFVCTPTIYVDAGNLP